MVNFHNKIFVCNSVTNIKGIEPGTKFHFYHFKDNIHIKIIHEEISAEFVGLLKSEGFLEGILNYYNTEKLILSGICTLQIKKILNEVCRMSGIWLPIEFDCTEIKIILEEQVTTVE
ncbi:hypothetical protein [Bacillus sp. Au-Bac7]|uniref:hypothetical protein n=1 Tax=Bacillus sp. Au-Bac7 TaxID=2906458 RepID=UPI001E348790|nr:hypothetical protein [Bacillus sp. Au-Bac7]MCE4052111.1 hypothetical protein [Bacillus sp. Au-Bac7]